MGCSVEKDVWMLCTDESSTYSYTESEFELSKGPPAPDLITVPPSGQFRLPDQVAAFILPRKLRLPTLDAWNLTVQHQLTPTLSLAIGYVGNKGTHVFPSSSPHYDPNQATIVGFGSLDTNERKPFFKKFGWTQPISYFGSD